MKSPLLTFHSQGFHPFSRYWEERGNSWSNPKVSFPAIHSYILFPSFWSHFTHENVQWNRIFCLLCPLFTCQISWQIRWRWSGSYIVCVHSQRDVNLNLPTTFPRFTAFSMSSLLDFSISLERVFQVLLCSPFLSNQCSWLVLYTHSTLQSFSLLKMFVKLVMLFR